VTTTIKLVPTPPLLAFRTHVGVEAEEEEWLSGTTEKVGMEEAVAGRQCHKKVEIEALRSLS